jgi:radical SAM/Cys-rich protein
MTEATAVRVLELLAASPSVEVLDVTGGAPELNPSFRDLVRAGTALGRKTIVRCNLTVLFEPGMEWLAEFYRENRVEIVASLPCYLEANVDKQRGRGVFEKSIDALRLLNGLGYGQPGSPLTLHLVYNPVGPSLPPAQETLQAAYKKELRARYGIEFNELLTITNMPISRFADQLAREGKSEEYMDLLVQGFNPATLPYLMCRYLVSISWDGRLFDCDFNQMLEFPMIDPLRPERAAPLTIWDISSVSDLAGGPIRTADHCLGCTAGSGSSCTGALS